MTTGPAVIIVTHVRFDLPKYTSERRCRSGRHLINSGSKHSVFGARHKTSIMVVAEAEDGDIKVWNLRITEL